MSNNAKSRSINCVHCGGTSAEPGFMEDRGEGSSGYVRWIAGPLERGIFGGAKRVGRQRRVIEAWRCTGCGNLHLFAAEPV
ncbi:hypothetical protein GOEFS_106_01050 [Gordonia effusa NBRC 100432]|uniref:Uncharacterized protein n=1 Tax=Gordonia effusa NBRC 100432 TaxID=1077974 RepID=H0R556_9ACTN|nr:hypothetical protein GOEFS_106_01050 [Gordonia effusa NBRC 100432]